MCYDMLLQDGKLLIFVCATVVLNVLINTYHLLVVADGEQLESMSSCALRIRQLPWCSHSPNMAGL